MLIKILENGTEVAVPGVITKRGLYIKPKKAVKFVIKPVQPKLTDLVAEPVIEPIVEPEEESLLNLVVEPITEVKDWFPSIQELNKMLKVDLEQLAREYNLNTKGLKSVLRDRLIAYAKENELFERW